ncbi:ABC transporter permease [Singulisphaera sp. PoT]|uniref:ABC transporter permease n=1 Tax=Singulisphaera sp. PoT TaxID=3411797 RepID=UPI003BF60002
MKLRLGLGPVFVYENLVLCRRWQVYAGRALLIGSLFAGLFVVWYRHLMNRHFTTYAQLATVGSSFAAAIMAVELVLALILVPAVTAGAICQDKIRGGLALMMSTDLSNTEIVLGKLALRLITLLGTVACGLPVLAIVSTLGGVDPVDTVLDSLVIVGVVCLGATLSLTFSVWASKPHEALMATYATFAVWLMALLLISEMYRGGTPFWLRATNPFWLIFGYQWFGPGGSREAVYPLLFFAGSLLISAGLALISIRCIRSAALKQAGRSGRRRRPSLPSSGVPGLVGLSLDRNPILWREWHRRQPSGWGRGLWTLFAVIATVVSFFACLPGSHILPGTAAFMVSIGLLMVSVNSATALAEERALGSLDILMATPLSSREIVMGKWWGAFRIVPKLAILPGLLGLVAMTWRRGLFEAFPFAGLIVALVLAYGALVTSFCLAFATWQRRLGRAVGLSVCTYIAITVVLPTLYISMTNGSPDGLWWLIISPFFGMFAPFEWVVWRWNWETYPDKLSKMATWIIVIGSAAYAILRLTIARFDACLGRVPEAKAWRPSPAPQGPHAVPVSREIAQ